MKHKKWIETAWGKRPQYIGEKKETKFYHEVEKTSVGRMLVDQGLASTRAKPIADAIELIFSSVCACDSENLNFLIDNYPEVLVLAQFYADCNGSPNRNFRNETETKEFFKTKTEVK